MKKIIDPIKKTLPPPALKTMADRLFFIALTAFTLGGLSFGIRDAFISVITSLFFYLCSLEGYSKKDLLSRGGRLFLLSVISVLLSTINFSYMLVIAPLYTFFLVVFERDDYHKGIPMFFLPLTVHLLSLGLPFNLIIQRISSASIGIIVALAAQLWIWPSGNKSDLPHKRSDLFCPLKTRYALRKSIGVLFILMTGRVIGNNLAVWSSYFFLILHSPVDTDILPKVGKRIGGTIMGGLLFLPLEYFIGSPPLIYLLAVVSLYFALLFIGHCYFTAVTFITLNILLYTTQTLPFEAVFKQRFFLAILGGAVALAVSFLLPMKKELLHSSVD